MIIFKSKISFFSMSAEFLFYPATLNFSFVNFTARSNAKDLNGNELFQNRINNPVISDSNSSVVLKLTPELFTLKRIISQFTYFFQNDFDLFPVYASQVFNCPTIPFYPEMVNATPTFQCR